jgi:hypothetical protein
MDRQDIDALLIGALYGELTPADEARLQTHLESHPADRTALSDLTRARDAVRESRILTVQLDPPQAISNVLLQEAARRAPRKAPADSEREGWFQRFVRMFASHPMMAAATMLVLVVGIAGSMYLSGGRDRFDQHASSEPSSTAVPMSPAASREGNVQVGGLAQNRDEAPNEQGNEKLLEESDQLRARAGSAYGADLLDGETALPGAGKNASGKLAKAEEPKVETQERAKVAAKPDTVVSVQADKKKATRNETTYVDVPARRPKPKDLDVTAAAPTRRDAPAAPVVTSDTGDVVGTDARVRNDRGPAPDPAATGAAPPTSRQIATEEAPKRDEDTTWARDQHDRVRVAVTNKDCQEASRLAVELSNRAPGYYTSNVEADRALKQCVSHINAARESVRLRSQKRATDERRSAPAPSSTPRR